MTPVNLPISSKMIGDIYVNTVSARELHASLGIRKDFSNWIKSQIDKLGLEKEIDYVIFAQKGENSFETRGRMLSEYTLTLDAAKHIAMASRTPQGKMVRTYLIEIEKRFWAERGVSDTPLDQIARGEEPAVPKGTFDLSPIIAIMETQTRIMETMQMQSTIALSLIDSISQSQDDIMLGMRFINGKARMILEEVAPRYRYDGPPMIKDTRISSEQSSILYSAVTTRAAYLAEAFNIKTDVIASAIFAGLKSRFKYSHYTYICEHEFDEAIEFANTFEIMR